MKITATKTHWDGTGRRPHSAQACSHLQAVSPTPKLLVSPFCKRGRLTHDPGQLALAHPYPTPI